MSPRSKLSSNCLRVVLRTEAEMDSDLLKGSIRPLEGDEFIWKGEGDDDKVDVPGELLLL